MTRGQRGLLIPMLGGGLPSVLFARAAANVAVAAR